MSPEKRSLDNTLDEGPPNSAYAAKLLVMVFGSFACFGLSFLARPISEAVGGDAADKGITEFVLNLPLWLGATALAVWAVVLCFLRWSALTSAMKAFAFLPFGTYVAIILLITFGTPTTDLVVSYVGQRDSMIIGTTTHYGEGSTIRERGKPELVSSGRYLSFVRVTWKESIEAEWREQVIDLSHQVPRFGRDRTVFVRVTDGGASCGVKIGRYGQSP